jgi:hypothetical protein
MLAAPLLQRIPRRRREVLPMTIAAGFVCSDGVLLASDTQYTGVEIRHGRKFWTLSVGDALVIVGGAGTEAALKRIREEAEDRLKPGMSKLQIVGAVEASLALVDQLLQLPDDQKTELLVAIRIDNRTLLYENQGRGLGLSLVDYDSQCVGIGFSLGLYFVRSLFRPSMSIRWAKIIAAHLIKNV